MVNGNGNGSRNGSSGLLIFLVLLIIFLALPIDFIKLPVNLVLGVVEAAVRTIFNFVGVVIWNGFWNLVQVIIFSLLGTLAEVTIYPIVDGLQSFYNTAINIIQFLFNAAPPFLGCDINPLCEPLDLSNLLSVGEIRLGPAPDLFNQILVGQDFFLDFTIPRLDITGEPIGIFLLESLQN